MDAEHSTIGRRGGRRQHAGWLGVALLALTINPPSLIAETHLRGPGKAINGDPIGDVIGNTGEPIDVTRFLAAREGDVLRVRLELAASVSPADSNRDDALFGFIDLDVDQQENTGVTAVGDYLRASNSGLGSDLLVDLSSYRGDDGKVDLLEPGAAKALARVPAVFGDRSLQLDIPVGLLGGNAAVSAAAVVGNVEAFTDVVPNGGFMATTDEAGEGVVLGGGRFAVDVSWRNNAGSTGAGSLVFQSDDSAVFWFFNEGNWELMVKVVDGCGLNDHFWVFSAATTDVEFTTQVTDTLTGTVKTYRNPLGASAPAVTDTSAFATCGAGSR